MLDDGDLILDHGLLIPDPISEWQDKTLTIEHLALYS